MGYTETSIYLSAIVGIISYYTIIVVHVVKCYVEKAEMLRRCDITKQ